jgi:hypothetical protein
MDPPATPVEELMALATLLVVLPVDDRARGNDAWRAKGC